MTVDALHFVLGESLGRVCRRVGADKSPDIPGCCIAVFDPGNSLSCGVRRRKANVDSWTNVNSVNASKLAPSHHHHQNGLGACISLVFCIFADHAQTHTTESLWPMAVLARFSGRYETIALQSRRYWSPVGIQHGLNELASSCGFAADPPSCTRRNVTLNTFHSGVWRILVSGKLGVHNVARRATELWRLHVRDSTISDLCPDQGRSQAW